MGSSVEAAGDTVVAAAGVADTAGEAAAVSTDAEAVHLAEELVDAAA